LCDWDIDNLAIVFDDSEADWNWNHMLVWGGVERERDTRIVKGSPLARRILVKYTVPEPKGYELTSELAE